MTLRIGSLCSGYGGLDLGVMAVLGGALDWHCEVDPNASKVLAHHWPDVLNLGDITAVDFSTVAPVDVLTAGFPCQDVSIAGKRAGIADGTRSGLWLHVARAIESLQPQLVVIENVRGLLSAPAYSDVEPCPWCLGDRNAPVLRALGAVLGDLAGLGFDAEWACVRASEVGAAHRRERVFITAWPTPNADRNIHRGRDRSGCVGSESRAEEDAPSWHGGHRSTAGIGGPTATHTVGQRPRVERHQRGDTACAPSPGWGPYAEAVARWEELSRPAPRPTDDRGRLNPRFVEWLMGLPDGHVTAVPGLSRCAQLRALGNGVVPQQAAYALRTLLTGYVSRAW